MANFTLSYGRMKERRSYRMGARAEQAAATRRRILDAAVVGLFGAASDQTLDAIALRAGVSNQSLVRIFGSKAALLEQGAAEARTRVVDQRGAAPVGEIAASVKVLLIHYETYGDRMVRARGREMDSPELRPGVLRERTDHRRWVARTYRPQLDRRPAERERVLNALTAVTDVGTWKLLRRDLELDRREVEATLAAMILAVAG